MDLYGPARTATEKSHTRAGRCPFVFRSFEHKHVGACISTGVAIRPDARCGTFNYGNTRKTTLWNKHSKGYCDRDLKARLWQEVCQNVVQNWDELSNQSKKNKGAVIQRKWKNLKDCFSRELSSQKKCESGQSGKKKRKYIYFDQLSFLVPTSTPRETTGNIKSMEECANAEIQSDEDNIQQTQDSRPAINRRKKCDKTRKEYTNEEEIMDILRKKQIHDENVSFAEMLIPMLRKLNEDQKFYAKIEILNVMDRAKRYIPHPVYPASMHTISQNVYAGSSTGMETVPPPGIYPGVMQNNSQFEHPGLTLPVLVTIPPPIYTNTSASYIKSEAGTSSSNFVNPRNIVITNIKKRSLKEPPIQENFNDFSINNSNDYYERFGKDLQASEFEVSQDSDDYYDVTM